MKEIQDALAAPFADSEIEWRIGQKTKDGKRASMLAYLDARAIMNRLDAVVGIGGWRDSYRESHGPKPGVECCLELKIGDEWIGKCDAADQTDIESVKGGYSDALKRAAVKWGIGRYLYSIPVQWADLNERGYVPDGWRPRTSANPAPARLERVRETLEKVAPTVAAAAEVQAGPPPEEKPTPEMRLALRQAWLEEGGNPDDTPSMWAAFNPILGRRGPDHKPFTAVEIARLLERRKAWSPARQTKLMDAPTEAPRGLEAS